LVTEDIAPAEEHLGLLDRACSGGHAASCSLYLYRLFRRPGRKINMWNLGADSEFRVAKEHLEAMCDAGDPGACRALTEISPLFFKTKEDFDAYALVKAERATALYTEACIEKGQLPDCLFVLYDMASGSDDLLERLIASLDVTCSKPASNDCALTAFALARHKEGARSQARKHLESGCKANNRYACAGLVTLTNREARWVNRACSLGFGQLAENHEWLIANVDCDAKEEQAVGHGDTPRPPKSLTENDPVTDGDVSGGSSGAPSAYPKLGDPCPAKNDPPTVGMKGVVDGELCNGGVIVGIYSLGGYERPRKGATLLLENGRAGRVRAVHFVEIDDPVFRVHVITCGQCRRIMGWVFVGHLAKMTDAQHLDLQTRMGLDSRKVLRTEARWRKALRKLKRTP
jgi:hypothetical protein